MNELESVPEEFLWLIPRELSILYFSTNLFSVILEKKLKMSLLMSDYCTDKFLININYVAINGTIR